MARFYEVILHHRGVHEALIQDQLFRCLLKSVRGLCVLGAAYCLQRRQVLFDIGHDLCLLSFGEQKISIAHDFADLIICHWLVPLPLLQLRWRHRLIALSSLLFQEAFHYQLVFEIVFQLAERPICELIALQEL